MASATSIPRFLLPRGPLHFHTPYKPHFHRSLRYIPSCARLASSTSPPPSTPQSKPRSLEEPSKFTPPSHPPRLVSPHLYKPAPTYGPSLTPAQKQRQTTTRYPHTFPPSGTWSYFILTSKWLHASVALSILAFFAGWSIFLRFKAESPYAGMLPSLTEFFKGPVEGAGRVVEVYRLQAEFRTEETKERRRRWVEDAVKGKAFRVVHGLEGEEGQSREVMGVVRRMRGEREDVESGSGSEEGGEGVEGERGEEKRPAVKKWLGIW